MHFAGEYRVFFITPDECTVFAPDYDFFGA